MDRDDRPYAVGFNGHAQCCKCERCYESRQKAFKKWVSTNAFFPYADDPSKTVFVRPFWRQGPTKQKKSRKHLRLVG